MADSLVLINGLPGAGKTTLARSLAAALDAPALSKDLIKEALFDAAIGRIAVETGRELGGIAMDAVWAMAGTLSGLVIVESWWMRQRDLDFAKAGLCIAGSPKTVEVWCEIAPEVARTRYASRRRHPLHEDAIRLSDSWEAWSREARPLDLGPIIKVDTSAPVDPAAVAAQVLSALA